MATFGHKQSSSSQYLIPSLIALAICYSFVYNFLLYGAVERDIDPDANCAVIPGENDSPHCSELHLFREWHVAEIVSDEPEESLLAESKPTFPPSAASAATTATQAAAEVAAPGSAETMPLAEVAVAKPSQEQRASLRHAQFDKLEEETRASLSTDPLTPWAKDLMEQEKHNEEDEMLQNELHHEPTAQEKQTVVEWQDQVEKLGAVIHHALHADSNAVWASDLLSLKHRLENHMSFHMRRSPGHDDKVFAIRHAQLEKLEEALHATPNAHFRTAWDKLGSVEFELQQMRVRLEFEMSSHALKQHATKAPPKIAERQAVDSTQEQLEQSQDKAEELKVEIAKSTDIAASMVSLERGLADIVSDRFHHAPVVEATTAAPTGFLEKRALRWSSVAEMSRSIVIGGASHEHQVVSKRELRHLKWSGKLPKVSCITAISYSRHTRARMMYFVDNFKLQDYEGERQLLLVYHYADTDAAELVKKYADGVTIKGVAARSGSAQDFPNSQALRYGAWSADADVIARWEFEEWHDPSRLTMQVRALAATARPGCILGRKPEQSTIGNTAEPTNGATDEKPVVADTSLAGSRGWMKVYWQPQASLESTVDGSWVSPPEAHIVQLNMFNARLASDASPLQPVHAQEVKDVESKPAVEEVDAKSEVKAEDVGEHHEWSLQECLDLDSSHPVPPLTADTEAAIDKNNGQGMSKMFHKLMTRRHDISQKLQLLCMETTLESDMKKHTFLRQHVEQMVSIRGQLDKHIASVADSFPDLKQLAAEETKSAVSNSESGSFPEEELGV